MDRNDGDGAARALRKARRLAPWEASYTYDQVLLGSRAGVPALALRAAEAGARLDPGDSSYAIVAGQVADAVHQPARARRWFDRALAEDPYGLDPLLAAAVSAGKAGDAGRVASLTGRALGETDTDATVWARVGEARAALGDDQGAATAYRRALRIAPTYAVAKQGLARLDR
jgi:predicted Zn-dependent protease